MHHVLTNLPFSLPLCAVCSSLLPTARHCTFIMSEVRLPDSQQPEIDTAAMDVDEEAVEDLNEKIEIVSRPPSSPRSRHELTCCRRSSRGTKPIFPLQPTVFIMKTTHLATLCGTC